VVCGICDYSLIEILLGNKVKVKNGGEERERVLKKGKQVGPKNGEERSKWRKGDCASMEAGWHPQHYQATSLTDSHFSHFSF